MRGRENSQRTLAQGLSGSVTIAGCHASRRSAQNAVATDDPTARDRLETAKPLEVVSAEVVSERLLETARATDVAEFGASQ